MYSEQNNLEIIEGAVFSCKDKYLQMQWERMEALGTVERILLQAEEELGKLNE